MLFKASYSVLLGVVGGGGGVGGNAASDGWYLEVHRLLQAGDEYLEKGYKNKNVSFNCRVQGLRLNSQDSWTSKLSNQRDSDTFG